MCYEVGIMLTIKKKDVYKMAVNLTEQEIVRREKMKDLEAEIKELAGIR